MAQPGNSTCWLAFVNYTVCWACGPSVQLILSLSQSRVSTPPCGCHSALLCTEVTLGTWKMLLVLKLIGSLTTSQVGRVFSAFLMEGYSFAHTYCILYWSSLQSAAIWQMKNHQSIRKCTKGRGSFGPLICHFQHFN